MYRNNPGTSVNSFVGLFIYIGVEKMGYILLLIFILTWLNVRKIRKALLYLARMEGYPVSLRSKILDIIAEYSDERKEHKKQLRKDRYLKRHGLDPDDSDNYVAKEGDENDED